MLNSGYQINLIHRDGALSLCACVDVEGVDVGGNVAGITGHLIIHRHHHRGFAAVDGLGPGVEVHRPKAACLNGELLTWAHCRPLPCHLNLHTLILDPESQMSHIVTYCHTMPVVQSELTGLGGAPLEATDHPRLAPLLTAAEHEALRPGEYICSFMI